MVKFKILGSATEKIGAKELELKQDNPTKIRNLIPNENLNEELYIVLVNEKSKNLDVKVSGEDSVVIMPKISGG